MRLKSFEISYPITYKILTANNHQYLFNILTADNHQYLFNILTADNLIFFSYNSKEYINGR